MSSVQPTDSALSNSWRLQIFSAALREDRARNHEISGKTRRKTKGAKTNQDTAPLMSGGDLN
jgi:hypothetical protein